MQRAKFRLAVVFLVAPVLIVLSRGYRPLFVDLIRSESLTTPLNHLIELMVLPQR